MVARSPEGEVTVVELESVKAKLHLSEFMAGHGERVPVTI